MNRIRMLKVFILLSVLVLGAGLMQAQTQDNPTPIAYDEAVAGSLTTDTPELFYAFDATAGDVLDISLTSPDFDTIFFIFDADGNEVDSDDDGGTRTNSRIIGFEVPQTGTYTVRVTSWNYRDSDDSNIATGDFTFSITPITALALDINSTSTVDVDTEAASTLYFTFEASDGDVFDIVADSGGTLDTRLILYSPFGFQINSNDDSEGSVDPALLEEAVTSNGTYLLLLEAQNPNAVLSGEVTIRISESELATLNAGAVVVRLDSERDTQVFTFDAEAGETIRLDMTVEARRDFGSPSIEVFQEEDVIAAARSLQGVDAISFTFVVPTAGTVNVSVNSFSEMEATLSLVRVETEE